MAVYKKKGYKKNKKSSDDLEYLKKDSTTAEVFTSLDEGASRIEKFIEKNQKWIFSGLAIIILAVAGYMWYDSNVKQPREKEAINEMVKPEQFFNQALEETDETVIKENFEKALNGAEGKYGFIKIAEKYSGTKAGELAEYYIGVIAYKNGDFKKAVEALSKFNAGDDILQPKAYGLIGDAFMELEQPKDALEYYEKAAQFSDNSFTAPAYYFKAGRVALELGDKAKAKKYFETVKEKYHKSEQAKNIDIFMAQAE